MPKRRIWLVTEREIRERVWRGMGDVVTVVEDEVIGAGWAIFLFHGYYVYG